MTGFLVVLASFGFLDLFDCFHVFGRASIGSQQQCGRKENNICHYVRAIQYRLCAIICSEFNLYDDEEQHKEK